MYLQIRRHIPRAVRGVEAARNPQGFEAAGSRGNRSRVEVDRIESGTATDFGGGSWDARHDWRQAMIDRKQKRERAA